MGKFNAWGVCTTVHTSLAVTFSASQSILGRRLHRKEGLYSMSDCSSSASLKWRGKERGEVLHALTAQVKKFTVRIFISDVMCSRGRKCEFEIHVTTLPLSLETSVRMIRRDGNFAVVLFLLKYPGSKFYRTVSKISLLRIVHNIIILEQKRNNSSSSPMLPYQSAA